MQYLKKDGDYLLGSSIDYCRIRMQQLVISYLRSYLLLHPSCEKTWRKSKVDYAIVSALWSDKDTHKLVPSSTVRSSLRMHDNKQEKLVKYATRSSYRGSCLYALDVVSKSGACLVVVSCLLLDCLWWWWLDLDKTKRSQFAIVIIAFHVLLKLIISTKLE